MPLVRYRSEVRRWENNDDKGEISKNRQKKEEEGNTYTSIAVNMDQTMRNNPIAFDSSCGSEYAAMTPVPGMRMAE